MAREWAVGSEQSAPELHNASTAARTITRRNPETNS